MKLEFETYNLYLKLELTIFEESTGKICTSALSRLQTVISSQELTQENHSLKLSLLLKETSPPFIGKFDGF